MLLIGYFVLKAWQTSIPNTFFSKSVLNIVSIDVELLTKNKIFVCQEYSGQVNSTFLTLNISYFRYFDNIRSSIRDSVKYSYLFLDIDPDQQAKVNHSHCNRSDSITNRRRVLRQETKSIIYFSVKVGQS